MVVLRLEIDDVVDLDDVSFVQLGYHEVKFGHVSLLIPAKWNCSSAWMKHVAGRSAQNDGSRTATLAISSVAADE
jgi:hypothetical protein